MVDESENVVILPIRSKVWGVFFLCASGLMVVFTFYLSILPSIYNLRFVQLTESINKSLKEGPGNQSIKKLAEQKSPKNYKANSNIGLEVIWLILAGNVFSLGKRLLAADALAQVRRDRRPPVIYLRSFKDDAFDGAEIKETDLVKHLRKIGPVLAIGRPDEKLTHQGAARLYVSHASWQNTAKLLISKCQFLVLRAGMTPGLFWEIESVRQSIDPKKFALLVSSSFQNMESEENYELFRPAAETLLGCALPLKLKGREIILFDSDWKPTSVDYPNSRDGFQKNRRFWFSEMKALAIVFRKRWAINRNRELSPTLYRHLRDSMLETRPTPPIHFNFLLAPMGLAGAVLAFMHPSFFAELIWIPNPSEPPPLIFIGTVIEITIIFIITLSSMFHFYLKDPFRQQYVFLTPFIILFFYLFLGIARIFIW